jgi:hypothetical protein
MEEALMISRRWCKSGASNMLNNIGVYTTTRQRGQRTDLLFKITESCRGVTGYPSHSDCFTEPGYGLQQPEQTYDKSLGIITAALYLSEAIDNRCYRHSGGNVGEIYLNKAIKVDTSADDKVKHLDSALFYLVQSAEAYISLLIAVCAQYHRTYLQEKKDLNCLCNTTSRLTTPLIC